MAERTPSIRTLLVEKNTAMAGLLRDQLHATGIGNVTKVHSTELALGRLRHFEYDVVLVNTASGPHFGADFVRAARYGHDVVNPFVAIICLSDFATPQHVADCRDAGTNAFLARPVSAVQIRDKIRGAVSSTKPFVLVPGYFGPDRRHTDSDSFWGAERRLQARGQTEANRNRDRALIGSTKPLIGSRNLGLTAQPQ